jgi:hypothetical protein
MVDDIPGRYGVAVHLPRIRRGFPTLLARVTASPATGRNVRLQRFPYGSDNESTKTNGIPWANA